MVDVYEAGKYHTYEEVREMLEGWVAACPELAQLESVGKTLDGKDLWLITLTDRSTGPASDKPAMWCDGNTHAGEVAGCQACLHLVHTIVTRWRAGDAWMRDVMATSTAYVLPRLSADGAEYMLRTPHSCRSSPVLLDPLELPGHVPNDIDGDGKLLMMRIPDPAGGYRESKLDKRLMVQRLPHERAAGETYYRVLPEGTFRDYDGFTQRRAATFSLDANRQFPYEYAPEGVQLGAASYPGYLPQARHLVEAVSARNNICTMQSYHTHGRMVLWPNGLAGKGGDLAAYSALSDLGARATKYQVVLGNYFNGPVPMARGSTTGWAYESRGILAFANEIWNLMEEALKGHNIKFDHGNDLGMGSPKGPTYVPSKVDRVGAREEDYVKLYQWLDRNYPGKYVQEWRPFNHPQLGPVEIGGVDDKWCLQNPPPDRLEAELVGNTEFALVLLGALPAVKVKKASATPLGGGQHLVVLVLRNEGFLASNGSEKALKSKAVRSKAVCTLTLGPGQALSQGRTVTEFDHLAGRSRGYSAAAPVISRMAAQSTNYHEAKLEWVVKAPRGGAVGVEADFQRAGRLKCTISLMGSKL